ncbi:MAG: flp 1 [Verrucomicrobiales bacterium]|nr:flp 1 [Verrucomicrobiales bacterium]
MRLWLIPFPTFQMKTIPSSTSSRLLRALALLGCGLLSGLASAQAPLPRSSPEAQGIPSAKIRGFIEAADREVNTMHSFMLVRHGKVVAEAWWAPESAEKPHQLWSLSKSFTSTAVGMAVNDGKFKLDDKVLSFFPDEAPAEASENLKAMTVKDLLTMTAGHETEAKFVPDTAWVKTFLAQPVPFAPGTHFQYNTPATHMLSAIVRKTTGETVLDYLKPRLFEPLGIKDPQWAASPQGNTLGGWGLFVRTEDIAKFGELYLRKGMWNGKQLIPAEWTVQATAKQVPNHEGKTDPDKSDWAQGYGYQFWRCRHGAYRGDGKDGQYCIVLPAEDAVIAITADTGDMQKELNVVWDHLLPALQGKDGKLPENAEEAAKLKALTAGLKVREKSKP